jgi:hypothetical protein
MKQTTRYKKKYRGFITETRLRSLMDLFTREQVKKKELGH